MSKTTDPAETTAAAPAASDGELANTATDDKDAAAPSADQPEAAQDLTPRPTASVASLMAHPGNVRRDLDVNDEFVASIAANGVLVPLRITPGEEGGFRVIDGHRRLTAAAQVGLAEVPVDLASDRAADEAGQFLDMWTAHRHRKPLTQLEEADALFAARDAGATKTRIRKSTGLKPPEITAALTASRLSGDTRDAVEALSHELTLEDLAVMAEFEGDEEAIGQLLDAARWHGGLHHQAERLRQERADQAEHDRLCQELKEAGYSVTTELPPGGQLLDQLTHDGEDMSSETHTTCPGRGVFFRSYDLTTPVHYCADPGTHGHTLRHDDPVLSAGPSDAAGTPVGPLDGGSSDPSRQLVVRGNKAWKAAALVRQRWLAANLFPRRTAPREVAQFVARQLLRMPDPLRQGLASAHSRSLFATITGQTADKYLDTCDTATAGRLPLLMLAPITVAYEQAMAEGEGKNTWRTDRYSPCPRREAGHYLTFLASLGYQLSDIERAVSASTPYTGDTPAGGLLPDHPSGSTTDEKADDTGELESSTDDGMTEIGRDAVDRHGSASSEGAQAAA